MAMPIHRSIHIRYNNDDIKLVCSVYHLCFLDSYILFRIWIL